MNGCGDHSCVIAPPKGVGTNGGCRCDERALRRGAMQLRARVADLERTAQAAEDMRDAYAARVRELEKEIREARNEAATVRRAYLHEKRPILFSGPLVRAILDGRKSVTRRLVRERAGYRIDVTRDGVPVYVTGAPDDGGEPIPCPYGEPGDRLWVKETWRPRPSLDVEGIPDGAGVSVQYAADGAEVFVDERRIPDTWTMPKSATHGNVSSLLMPRWASRILLEITGVRVERLHQITDEDVFAEGLDMNEAGTFYVEDGEDELAEFAEPRDAFAFLWDGINGRRAPWESNPWVWRVEFRRVTQEESRHVA